MNLDIHLTTKNTQELSSADAIQAQAETIL